MAWTTPLTAVTNAALTTNQWNASVRDNLNATAVALATAPSAGLGKWFVSTGTTALAQRDIANAPVIAASQTLGTAGSYLDLATVGPTIVVTTGIQALVFVSANVANSAATDNFVDFAVSVGTTRAASDTTALRVRSTAGAANFNRASCLNLITGLNAAANTFTVKYKVAAITGQFADRNLVVMGL
jgi:hypothetical protein